MHRVITEDLNITPQEVKARLDRGEDLMLLDVRNPWEYTVARIPGSTLIPLAELPYRLDALPQDKDVVVVCHTGNRSLQATLFLRQRGLERVKNLAGGIDAWSTQVDPSVPRYK